MPDQVKFDVIETINLMTNDLAKAHAGLRACLSNAETAEDAGALLGVMKDAANEIERLTDLYGRTSQTRLFTKLETAISEESA